MRFASAALLWLFSTLLAPAQVTRLSDRVFLVPDKAGSAMRFEMIVNAGALDEADGVVRGIAHYLEHLVLVGRNPEHGDTAMRMFADGSANGWTNDRATAYLHIVPPRSTGHEADLERLFRFYAARLRDFTITDADALRERNVVLQEHDLRTQTSASSLFFREVNRRFIPDHPAGGWIIGTRDSIQAMTLEDARAYHRAWYGPNNVWFVVRSSLAPETIKTIADRALAGIPARPLPERLKDRLPAIEGVTEPYAMQHPDVTRTSVVAGRMTRLDEPDYLRRQAALSLLSAFLNSRFSGSGHDNLVEVRRVAADDINLYLRRVAPSTYALTVAASVAGGKTPGELEAAIKAYLDALPQNGLPNEAQLARLKKRMIDQFRRADDQPEQVHSRLVSWLADGRPPERLAEWPAIVESIMLDDLRPIAIGLSQSRKLLAARLEPAEEKQ